MGHFNDVASNEVIETAATALRSHQMNVTVVENAKQAVEEALKLVPEGARVFTATSETLRTIGLEEKLNAAPYQSIREEIKPLYGQPEKQVEMRRLGATADVAAGSVHAITEDGKLLIASRTGSQLPNIAYGAKKLVFVVGAQKIVSDLQEGVRRIEEHVVPLEDARSQVAYGTGTKFAKLLVLNWEDDPERINVIIVKEPLGF